MAGFPNFSSTPVQNLVGAVQNVASNQNPDGTLANVSLDRQGALIVAERGGRFSAAANRVSGGNVFISSTAVAGVTVPVPATTLASKAGLVNPAGSGINMELIALALSSVTIEVALKNFAMEFQLNASLAGAPTSVTKLTANPMPLSSGKGAATGFAYTAATMTNAAANPLVLPLFGNYETAVGNVPTWFYFNGEIVMGPDTVMAITNVASILAVQVVYVWAEWLP